MGIRVGMVCEGSYDYNVIEKFVQRICEESNVVLDTFDCLQPEVSATFQTSDGGWTKVKSWCERGGGKFYRQFFDEPLFGSSKQYDLIIVHLDGDVAQICEEAPLTGLKLAGLAPSKAVEAIKSAILNNWLSLEEVHNSKVVACVPVRHLEAWLLTCLDPSTKKPESKPTKYQFRMGPAKKYPGKERDRYIAAAGDAVSNLVALRNLCVSYQMFEADFRIAASAP